MGSVLGLDRAPQPRLGSGDWNELWSPSGMSRHPGAMRNNRPALTLLNVWMGKRCSARSVNQAHIRIPGLLLIQVLQRPRTTPGGTQPAMKVAFESHL